MKRVELEEYLTKTYLSNAEFLWKSAPSFAVFRHSENKKWFAVIMKIPKCKLGLKQEGEIEIINLKTEPLLLYELLQDNAIFRAYHMNKEKWISVDVLNVEKDKLKWLIDISFNLTK